MTKHLWLLTLAGGVLLTCAGRASAQTTTLWEGGVGDYIDPANWGPPGFPPEADFTENGAINNGGTAQVSSDITQAPENISGTGPLDFFLGQASGESGTLEVLSGGVMPVGDDMFVGDAGEGHLIVRPGGTLTTVDDLTNSGAATSSILLDGSGPGMTTVTVGLGQADPAESPANLERNITVIGPNVDFTAGTLNLAASNTLTAQITDATHSPLKALGNATLGGDLVVEFDGVTPAPGDAWTLVDAADISGGFASVTANTTIERGFSLGVRTGAGGMNGQVAELALEGRLMLSVNRATGEATLNNVTTTESFDIDGYLVTSSGNSLDPASWNSLEAQGEANWRESNPAASHVGELNLEGSTVIGSESSRSLGNVYSPTQFGVDEDLTFEYNVAGQGTVEGLIEYSGPPNNLALYVDPDTGEAALQNGSTVDVSINGYLITSESSSLDSAGWTSLESSGEAGWRESNPADNHISELNLSDSLLLAGRNSSFSLGTLFDPNGEQDLEFTFNVAGGDVMTGVVLYEDIPPINGGGGEELPGDYNDNGQVEQADLNLVLLNWGDSFEGLPAEWVNERPTDGIVDQVELNGVLLNWGATAAAGLSAAGSVPEPGTCVLLVLAGIAGLAILRR